MDQPVTADILARHGLTEEEYGRIQALLGRTPNAVELGMFSAMWSEHCSYKSSRVHLKRLPTAGVRVVQGPGENAGAVDIGDGDVAVFKIESHNHPSFIEPYQGAATGVGGILRDVFTMGARPIALLNALRFGQLDQARNRYLVRGVVAGIAGYGNCVGVPTVGGEVVFNDIYSKNPLVNVLCVGITSRDRLFKGQAAGAGNPVLYMGAKTGRDGIHGATMASDSFDASSEAKRPTVQVGDPFLEKLLLEACLELMQTDSLIGIQDMGAAGLTSSSAEMAARAESGIELDLDRIPRRETGMTPYDLMLSESQERMLLVVKKGCEQEVLRVCHKWGLDAAVIGRVTADGMIRIVANGESSERTLVAEIPARALTEEAPRYERPASPPGYQEMLQSLNVDALPDIKDPNTALLTLLESPTLASKAWIYEQFDSMVGVNTCVRPGSDAAVVRIQGSRKALALTTDGNSLYCLLNPYVGGALAVAEAARNLRCAGAEPLGVTDCLNFGNPERPEVMWQFMLCLEGIADACTTLALPIVSGNVSFYNETNGLSIYPTPVIGMVGLLKEADRAVSQWFKRPGDRILLLGETREDLGGSEYMRVIQFREQGTPPWINLETEQAVQACLTRLTEEQLVRSAHDCSEGGLAVALAESCLSNPFQRIGCIVELKEPGLRRDALLFGETPSRVVLSVDPSDVASVTMAAEHMGVKVTDLGEAGGDRLVIRTPPDGSGRPCTIDLEVERMFECWRSGLERALEGTG